MRFYWLCKSGIPFEIKDGYIVLEVDSVVCHEEVNRSLESGLNFLRTTSNGGVVDVRSNKGKNGLQLLRMKVLFLPFVLALTNSSTPQNRSSLISPLDMTTANSFWFAISGSLSGDAGKLNQLVAALELSSLLIQQ